MNESQPRNADDLRLCYIYTTFPLVSETFLQREMQIMKGKVQHLRLYTIWGGKRKFEDLRVHKFELIELLTLFYWLPYWYVKRKEATLAIFRKISKSRPQYFKNWLETLLGIAFAFIRAKQIQKWQPDLIHAVWATMPSTAALLLKGLIDTPFSMGAHAYDIFQKGGDCLLKPKAENSNFIHSSTQFAKDYLVELGADAGHVHMIRRGLSSLPPINQLRKSIHELRILTIGRLVEKKGYEEQLKIYNDLRRRAIPFKVDIVGEGPLRKTLEHEIEAYGLSDHINLVGAIPHAETQFYYSQADLFVFTGVIAKDGDRNGLANVIPEAMARGLPVLSTPDTGVMEAFKADYELAILPLRPTEDWVLTIKDLIGDYPRRKALGAAARLWTETNFNARKNTQKLYNIMIRDFESRN